MDFSALRFLLLEDEPLLLLDLQEALTELGVTSINGCTTIYAATQAASTSKFDLAILDVMVGKDTSAALAHSLVQQGTRIAFISGTQGDFLPPDLRAQPLLHKPYSHGELKAFLQGLMA